jgi:nucleoid-associated protein YgaU
MASIVLDYENSTLARERLANAMSIIELDGKERTIILTSTSLPHRGVSWGMEQRIHTRWPAGSPEATQQLLGATQTETKMDGVWRRTWLGRNPVSVEENGTEFKVVYPRTLRDLFFDLLNQGALLQVVWGSISRMGRLSTFDAPHDREDDISWNASFHWINAGETFPKRMVSTRNRGVRQEVDGLLMITQSINEMEATEIAITPRVTKKVQPGLTIGQVSAFIEAPKKLVDSVGRKLREVANKIKQAADLATKLKNMPYEVNNSILASAENIVATCNQFHDEFTRIPPEQATFDHRVTSLSKTASYYANGTRQTEYLARVADELRVKARQRRGTDGSTSSSLVEVGDVKALHLVKAGDTLASISLRYYGNPDKVVELMRANKLTPPVRSVTTAEGRPAIGDKSILLIPRL